MKDEPWTKCEDRLDTKEGQNGASSPLQIYIRRVQMLEVMSLIIEFIK